MPTIDRQSGFRVVVNTDDHGVPHVHVQRNGEWAKIAIGSDQTGAYLLDPKGMRVRDLIDEALEGDRLPDGSVEPDGTAQHLLQALEAEVEHLRRALAAGN